MDGVDVGADVAVAQDDALREPGGSRGVDEPGDVLCLRRCGGNGTRPPGLEQRGVGMIVRRRQLEPDHVLEGRDVGAHLPELLGDRVCGADRCPRRAVLDDEVPLLRELRLVHRDEGGPEPVRGVAGHRPFHPVVGDDRDLVPAPDAEAGEAAAERADHLVEPGVGDPRPPGRVLDAEELPIGIAPAALLAEVDQVLELHRHGGLPPLPVRSNLTAPLQSRRGSAIRSRQMADDRGQSPEAPELPVPTTHRLSDGTLVRIRPVTRDDRDRLRNGFARLSAESKYRRFLAAPATLSESTLDYLTGTDGWNHLALGAELAAPGADTSYGLGIARFVRLEDDPAKAEAAVAVIDEVQRRGLGRLLLRELICAARQRGVTTFV